MFQKHEYVYHNVWVGIENHTKSLFIKHNTPLGKFPRTRSLFSLWQISLISSQTAKRGQIEKASIWSRVWKQNAIWVVFLSRRQTSRVSNVKDTNTQIHKCLKVVWVSGCLLSAMLAAPGFKFLRIRNTFNRYSLTWILPDKWQIARGALVIFDYTKRITNLA